MLRAAVLRVTRPRLAVLSVAHDQPHADTDSIITAVWKGHCSAEGFGPVSHQAVYDVLHALTAAGLVRRFQPSGSVARYEARVGTTITTSSAGCVVPSPTSTARSATPPAWRRPTVPATRSTELRSSSGVDARSVSRQRRPAAEGDQPSRGTGETGKRERRDRDIRPERQDRDREHQRERESRDPQPYAEAADPAADEPGLVAESAGPVGSSPARAPVPSSG